MSQSRKIIDKLTFEQALLELEKVVNELSNGEEDIDEAIKKYRYGNDLKNYCKQKLEQAKLEITEIKEDQINNKDS